MIKILLFLFSLPGIIHASSLGRSRLVFTLSLTCLHDSLANQRQLKKNYLPLVLAKQYKKVANTLETVFLERSSLIVDTLIECYAYAKA